jgi:hypothetical protein
VSAGEFDVVLLALASALGLLLAGWGAARAFQGLRRRFRRLLRHVRHRSATRYEEFDRLVEQALLLEGQEPNSGQHRRGKKTPRYRRADNGQYTTETYAREHPTKTVKE